MKAVLLAERTFKWASNLFIGHDLAPCWSHGDPLSASETIQRKCEAFCYYQTDTGAVILWRSMQSFLRKKQYLLQHSSLHEAIAFPLPCLHEPHWNHALRGTV